MGALDQVPQGWGGVNRQNPSSDPRGHGVCGWVKGGYRHQADSASAVRGAEPSAS